MKKYYNLKTWLDWADVQGDLRLHWDHKTIGFVKGGSFVNRDYSLLLIFFLCTQVYMFSQCSLVFRHFQLCLIKMYLFCTVLILMCLRPDLLIHKEVNYSLQIENGER